MSAGQTPAAIAGSLANIPPQRKFPAPSSRERYVLALPLAFVTVNVPAPGSRSAVPPLMTPAVWTLPAASTAIVLPRSDDVPPPRRRAQVSPPAGVYLATKEA